MLFARKANARKPKRATRDRGLLGARIVGLCREPATRAWFKQNKKRWAWQLPLFLVMWLGIFLCIAHGHVASAQVDVPAQDCGQAVNAWLAGPSDDALQLFQTSSALWPQRSIDAVASIFYSLLTISFIQGIVQYYMAVGTLDGFLASFVPQFFNMALLTSIFVNSPGLIRGFLASAGGLGQSVVGAAVPAWASNIYAGFEPTRYLYQGLCLGNSITLVTNDSSLNWWQHIIVAIPVVVAGLIIVLAYSVIAFSMTMAALEAYFVGGIGPLVLGLLGHRSLSNIPNHYIGALIGLFMKIVVMSAMAAYGVNFATTWTRVILQAANSNDLGHIMSVLLSVMMAAFMFCLLVWYVPLIVQRYFGGGAAITGSVFLGSVRNAVSMINMAAPGPKSPGGGGGGGGAPPGGPSGGPPSVSGRLVP